jgi:MerR family transcriptional regulator, light-induced transcriptional regulator
VSGLSILAVSRLTHLTADTIRAWEKRYAAVRPARRPGGQRQFSDDDVSRLTLLREAVDAGQSISNIARLPTGALRELVRYERQVGNDLDSPIEHLLHLIASYDFIRLRPSLAMIGATRSAVEFYDGIVGPLIEEIECSADDPHVRATKQKMLAAGIHSVSAQLFERYTPAVTAPSFIMSTFPGEAYSVAALLGAIVAAEIGFRGVFLGQMTPAELQSLATASAPAAVGVYIGAPNADYARMLADLRNRLSGVTVVACGAGAAFGSEQHPIRSMRDLSDALLRLEQGEVEDHAGPGRDADRQQDYCC